MQKHSFATVALENEVNYSGLNVIQNEKDFQSHRAKIIAQKIPWKWQNTSNINF